MDLGTAAGGAVSSGRATACVDAGTLATGGGAVTSVRDALIASRAARASSPAEP